MRIAGKPVKIRAIEDANDAAGRLTELAKLKKLKKPKYIQKQLDQPFYYVHQKEYGISGTLPMGTIGVFDCLVLVLRNPVTKATTLVHIDKTSDLKTLDPIWEDMASNGISVQASLIGASFAEDNEERARAIVSNVYRTIFYLSDKPVNIIAADLYSRSRQHVNVFVNPTTGKIHLNANKDKIILDKEKLIISKLLPNMVNTTEIKKAFNLLESPNYTTAKLSYMQQYQVVMTHGVRKLLSNHEKRSESSERAFSAAAKLIGFKYRLWIQENLDKRPIGEKKKPEKPSDFLDKCAQQWFQPDILYFGKNAPPPVFDRDR